RHAQPHPVRAGRDPQPSLPAQGDDGARGSRPRPRPCGVRPRVLGSSRAQLGQQLSRVGAGVDRRRVRAGAGGGANARLLQAARALRLGLRARRRHGAADLGRRAQRQEMLSARFGDILSELYLLSAVLKRWDEEGRQRPALPLVAWCMEAGFATIEARFDSIFANFPNRPVAWLLRFMLLPLGLNRRGPSDRLTRGCAEILLNPSATRERLTVDIFPGTGAEGLPRLERAFALTVATQPLRERLHTAHIRDVEAARQEGLIN